MTNRVCWSCKVFTHMTVVESSAQIKSTGGLIGGRVAYRSQAVFNCDNCQHLSIAERISTQPDPLSALMANGARLTWLPATTVQQDFPDVPDHIAGAATEATLCFSAGAYRAVGSLARAVIEATAKDKRAEGKDLYSRIEQLHADGHVRLHTKEQAHEVRHFGNGMAHGDFTKPVTQEEAEEIVELMKEILDEVYQSPARLSKRRAARAAKTASPDQPAP
ncbi:DUF4145 domain-containing protein [Nocardioides sp. CFH 31398]|uniref:DUF4145 domain-containing protein n=1 Tax=Nocardioides sp. CFH 31398 TaxID=2919579 RepID=UPI001F059E97|nr:DUF4145 domain-containing protein [Nocardioides sp. CFH 31398]MCH1867063.1 DUF4145 domain-containing protein [Nocardioides sp. CFH 31398]